MSPKPLLRATEAKLRQKKNRWKNHTARNVSR